MDGLILCKRVREELKLKDLPVVMFSSLINESMARKCDSVGASSYITKPEMGELGSLVDKLCL
jgi:two-component system chemotaxis response regulator CheV